MSDLKTATSGNDRLEMLKNLAAILASEIDECESARDLAALARQYRETIREVDAIENGEDADDAIAAIILRNRESASDS